VGGDGAQAVEVILDAAALAQQLLGLDLVVPEVGVAAQEIELGQALGLARGVKDTSAARGAAPAAR
jgi:hypothetical protein